MSEANKDTLVLVTGASGFVAGHCIKALLEDGYKVRGTVRSLSNRAKVEHLSTMAPGVELVEADLTSDDGWDSAVAGATYVLHVASPFPAIEPDHEDELIRPAVDGTLRVLKAAANAGTVKRVVLTSSVAAVAYGHGDTGGRVMTEEDWSVVDNCAAYQKSKTLAERAAWDFVESLPDDKKIELSVINPGFVAGPLLSKADGTSAEVVKRLLNRDMPACPQLGFAMVDVRDIAKAQVAAMTTPAAAGSRYICAGEHIWMRDMAKILAKEFGPRGYKVPTGHLPYPILWLASRFDKTLRSTLVFIGRRETVSADKARTELGWSQRPYEETLIDMGNSAIELGLVPAK
jgi:nucleoside-diphosphate-sugar epimerase